MLRLWRRCAGGGTVAKDRDATQGVDMRISVDDWRFRDSVDDTLVLDVFLDNGQHALLEVNPMKNPAVINGDIPEAIVFCELPGERISEQNCPARWIHRPPTPLCPWSKVEMPMALSQQIKARLAQSSGVTELASGAT
jgi:hypothetical protein